MLPIGKANKQRNFTSFMNMLRANPPRLDTRWCRKAMLPTQRTRSRFQTTALHGFRVLATSQLHDKVDSNRFQYEGFREI
mmetsp:Transcript_90424/g.161099  ORF Transcript_90424/g.161099 Transcript_90424/m.161099 type:complete len:80 (+) Transcript_90424:144-383(+)